MNTSFSQLKVFDFGFTNSIKTVNSVYSSLKKNYEISQMSNIILSRLVICLLITFSLSQLFASHYAGGSIRYDFLGPGKTPSTFSYKITVTLIRDCAGINFGPQQQQEYIYARCAGTSPILGPIPITWKKYSQKPDDRPNTRGARDVSDICSSMQSNCESGQRTPYGYEAYYYETILDLPACNSWEIRYRPVTCCKPAYNNCLGGAYATYSTSINTSWFPISNPNGAPANSAPSFADEERPFPSACIGQEMHYGVGTFDKEGDSLNFKLTCPYVGTGSSGANPFTNTTIQQFNNGYTCTKPIDNFKLDSVSGRITFKTNKVGRFLVAFFVEEYDPCTKILKGRTYREVVFNVNPCSNNVPKDVSGISNVNGAFSKTGKFSLEVCEGGLLQWEDTIEDIDQQDTLLFKTNIEQVLSGAKYTILPLSRNKAVVQFEWLATLKNGTTPRKFFYLAYSDDRCTFPATNYSVFDIKINPGVYVSNEDTICTGSETILEAKGGNNYTWHFISGDRPVLGSNWFPLSGSNNKKVRFKPSQTTTLWVESDTLKNSCGVNITGGCQMKDTITIIVADSFSISTTPDFTACNPGNGTLIVNTSKPLTYSYSWSPKENLNQTSSKSVNFRKLTNPTQFQVRVKSSQGCIRNGVVNVSLTDPFPTNMKIVGSDSIICRQKRIKLEVDHGTINYGNCTNSGSACQGTFKDFNYDNGRLVNSAQSNLYPHTYGTFNSSQKSQYLYRASDLKSLGLTAGPIRSISWYLLSLNNSPDSLNNFSIKMGCVAINDLPTGSFLNQANSVVLSSTSYKPSQGWNTHQLDNEYIWDGVSNLLVEICFKNATFGTSHPIQRFTRTNYKSSSTFYNRINNPSDACNASIPNTGSPSTYLPNTKFNACTGIRSGKLKYSWGPTANGAFIGPNNLKEIESNANLSTTSKYHVYIQDSATGICKDTLDYEVKVIINYDVKPDSLAPQCLSNGNIKLNAPTPYNIITPGGKWTGTGIIDDTLGIWDPQKSGIGKHWLIYSITGDACSAKDSIQLEIVPTPDVSMIGTVRLCELYGGAVDTIRHRLTPKLAGGKFTGFGVDSVKNSQGKYIYYVDGTKFNSTKISPDTAVIKLTQINGCKHDTVYKIPIENSWDFSYLGIKEDTNTVLTSTFCLTNPHQDTLMVAGKNPTWEIIGAPGAIDSSSGAFNISHFRNTTKVNDDTTALVKVGNYGFCGRDTTFNIYLIKAPEVEIIDKIYCKAEFLANPNQVDTMFVRMPKGLGLITQPTKQLDTNGFNPLTEVMVSYATIGQSGWFEAFDGYPNQFMYHYWDNPANPIKNIARFRLKQLVFPKKNWFYYQFAFRYRNNATIDNSLCFSSDSGYVNIIDSIPVPLAKNYELCKSNPINITLPKYNNFNYKWSHGASGNKVSITTPGTYTVTVSNPYCTSTNSTKVISCLGIKDADKSKRMFVYPNPSNGHLKIAVNQNIQEAVTLTLYSVSGQVLYVQEFLPDEFLRENELNLSHLKSGNYILHLSATSFSEQFKLVLE